MRIIGFIPVIPWLVCGCSGSDRIGSTLPPNRTVVASQHPVATDPGRVGTYPALTKSGGGYFYDEVLEYRVWIHPAGGGDDYYRAFASFEPALEYSKTTPGAEEPLALVRQVEWIDEPQTGKFELRAGERLTEWQVPWLKGSKRSGGSIDRFLAERRKRK